FCVLGATLPGLITVSTEDPGISFSDLVTILVEEVNVIDLLESPTCKPGFMLNKIFQISFRCNDVITQHRFIPCPVSACPHSMHAGQAATITRNYTAGGKKETGQCHDSAILGI